MFDDYKAALRLLAGESLSNDSSLSVFAVVPRNRGAQVGFRVTGVDGEESLYYVEPPPRPSETSQRLPTASLSNGLKVVAWKYPADPRLPALATAVFPDACATLLQRMGRPSGILDLALIGYRPGRRAVIRVTTSHEVLFVKVVRPSTVEDTVRRHRMVFEAGVPTPQLVNWSSAGFFVLEQARGVSLVEAERLGLNPDHVAERIIEAQSLLGAVGTTGPARAPIVESRDWYFTQVEQFLPDLQEELASLRSSVDSLLEGSDPGPPTTIHGDAHAGQIFVGPTWPYPVTAIIDLDGCGEGVAVDDSAAACAHAVATAVLSDDARSTDFWSEVSLALASTLNGLEPRLRRFDAGVITHLVGHALNAHSTGRGYARELLMASQRFL